ncbi:hypothetical protein [Tropicimonas isoalkanivorans]|uniref:Uncharacterized protein n=1 Tax=Tropicimonas isoalkanivorans TaxID=441112 RepID=A0A1I1FY90_9RHOB|nr:hypothetical protein [Tropicimonas isoalkanivorans]SFC04265.1 hypothetical protein SAMN04488094_102336 [Tropicimonas isoalkanivorans]
MILQPLKAPDCDLWPADDRRRSEAELIRARIESREKWRRRRGWLRLRATLFGRRKERFAACPEGRFRPARPV